MFLLLKLQYRKKSFHFASAVRSQFIVVVEGGGMTMLANPTAIYVTLHMSQTCHINFAKN